MGNVTQARSGILDILNRTAHAIASQATRYGLTDVNTYYVKDVPSVKSTIEIQFGRTQTNQRSMVAQVDIYDDNNIKILLPDNLASMLGVPNFKACGSPDEAMQYITFLSERTRQG